MPEHTSRTTGGDLRNEFRVGKSHVIRLAKSMGRQGESAGARNSYRSCVQMRYGTANML